MSRETGGPTRQAWGLTELGRGQGSLGLSFLTASWCGSIVFSQSLPSEASARAALTPGLLLHVLAFCQASFLL